MGGFPKNLINQGVLSDKRSLGANTDPKMIQASLCSHLQFPSNIYSQQSCLCLFHSPKRRICTVLGLTGHLGTHFSVLWCFLILKTFSYQQLAYLIDSIISPSEGQRKCFLSYTQHHLTSGNQYSFLKISSNSWLLYEFRSLST